ncbi:MAG TPA: hypothetical protein VIZ68_08335 [Thermoplasmata archaeon]
MTLMGSALVGVALGLAVTLLALAPVASAASAGISLSSSGTLTVDLSASVANGSAVRSAVDGNFTPLVDSVISNASQRSTILQQIQVAESTPILGALFGNRDGTVTSAEVTQFENLLQEEAQLLPQGAISGTAAVGITLDDHGPASSRLAGVAFEDATGAVGSTAPMSVSTVLSYEYPYSGSSHRLALIVNLTPVTLPLGALTGAIGFSFSTPSAVSVTGTTGFDHVSVSNDALGWGAASVSGSFTPSSEVAVSVSFQNSVPWGDLLLVIPLVVAIGVVGFLLYRRRRRRRAAPP